MQPVTAKEGWDLNLGLADCKAHALNCYASYFDK